jgi:hypothetical protein
LGRFIDHAAWNIFQIHCFNTDLNFLRILAPVPLGQSSVQKSIVEESVRSARSSVRDAYAATAMIVADANGETLFLRLGQMAAK